MLSEKDMKSISSFLKKPEKKDEEKPKVKEEEPPREKTEAELLLEAEKANRIEKDRKEEEKKRKEREKENEEQWEAFCAFCCGKEPERTSIPASRITNSTEVQPNKTDLQKQPINNNMNSTSQTPMGQNPIGQQNPMGQNPMGQNPMNQNPMGQNLMGQNNMGNMNNGIYGMNHNMNGMGQNNMNNMMQGTPWRNPRMKLAFNKDDTSEGVTAEVDQYGTLYILVEAKTRLELLTKADRFININDDTITIPTRDFILNEKKGFSFTQTESFKTPYLHSQNIFLNGNVVITGTFLS